MKHFILGTQFLLLVFFSFCCSNSTIKAYSTKEICGDWVNTKYLRSVQMTKSAKKSQESCDYNYLKIHNDSVALCLHFHEGFDLKVDSLSKNIYFARYENDTIKFNIYLNSIIMSYGSIKDTFISYQMTFPNVMYANRLLNKEIFSGSFNVVDSADQTIVFSETGNVKGFGKFSMYTVLDDYYDAGCNYDILFLNNTPSDRTNEYTWNFKEDTLVIYKLDCINFDSSNHFCYDNKVGKIIYKLKKQ